MTRVAILQSNYIPWKGYFDMIAHVDTFILYDDMQFTRRDWRNRNKIKTAQGTQWLTVPVSVKGKYHQTIFETELMGEDWAEKHWRTIEQNYARAPHFGAVAEWLKPLYLDHSETHLSALNQRFLKAICARLGITTTIQRSNDYTLIDGKSERLADLCAKAGGTTYVSGPAAKDYIDPGVFKSYGLDLEWFSYDGYPEYPQLWGDFEHGVTILDLLFNCGDAAPDYMRYVTR
ncbi:MAG: WbqC family protein [Pseudomonadota bacterium]